MHVGLIPDKNSHTYGYQKALRILYPNVWNTSLTESSILTTTSFIIGIELFTRWDFGLLSTLTDFGSNSVWLLFRFQSLSWKSWLVLSLKPFVESFLIDSEDLLKLIKLDWKSVSFPCLDKLWYFAISKPLSWITKPALRQSVLVLLSEATTFRENKFSKYP